MSKVLRALGFFWAAPITVAGLLYVLLFSKCGWYKYEGKFDAAYVWSVLPDKSPNWLSKLWKAWLGHTIGNVVVLNVDMKSTLGQVTLTHEQVHVRQCMIMGIFQPIAYALMMLVIKIACPLSSPYYSNPFEIDARRTAGQLIDVEGTLARVQAAAAKVKATTSK